MAIVTMTVNGESERLSVDATETLLDALRARLDLRGTKLGCNQGVCGSCTVLIDGKPARACLTLVAGCHGRAITTIEGVGAAGKLSVVQKAFVEAGAVQCGYCTPGMVLTAEAFLNSYKKPSVAAIRDALSGNLCRCTGYVKIVDAVKLASERMPS